MLTDFMSTKSLEKTLKDLKEFFLDLLIPLDKEAEKLMELSDSQLLSTTGPAEEIEISETEAVIEYGDDLAKSLVWQIKYKGSRKLSEKAGRMLYEKILGRISEEVLLGDEKFLLIPVPLDKQKIRKKGFNQAELIAQAVLELDEGESLEYFPKGLRKTKVTKNQTEIKRRSERLKNLKDCFQASEEVRGRNIILIDDVITTGATIREARKTLKKAGAKKIWAFALAH